VKPVKVGICGLGTVGGGTFNVLQRNAEEIARRAGRGIEVAQIAMRTPKPQFQTTGIAITNDVFEVATNPEIDIVIELMGGYTVARELVLKAIENGRATASRVVLEGQESRHGQNGRWQGNQGCQVREPGFQTVRPRSVDRRERHAGHRFG